MRTTPLLALLILAAACGGSSATTSPGVVTNPGTTTPNPTPTPTVTTSVAISGFAFNPAAIQVASGSVVTWTNNDNTNHNVTFSATTIGGTADFATGPKSLTMPATAGTYAYHCTIHGAMTGTVEVK